MTPNRLLSRVQFRDAVFERDNYACVVPNCTKKVLDPTSSTFNAHHLVERRLWTDPSEREGYFVDNGASLCEPHHRYGAETCVLQPQVLRQWAGIRNVVLPKHFVPGKSYDKWGVELKIPTRKRIKYPSTPYLPMSPGADPNDINLTELSPFLNQPLIVTLKMDGSNVQLTKEYVAARNGTDAPHPSFDRLKSIHKEIAHLIPENVTVFGEWLYARHSIHYTDELALSSLFQPFGIYNQDTRIFGSWSEVKTMATKLGVSTTLVVGEGSFDKIWELEDWLTRIAEAVIVRGHEGIVVRTAYPFPYGNFEGYETGNGKTTWRVNAIAKYVRANHVQTDEHWSHGPIVKNITRDDQ